MDISDAINGMDISDVAGKEIQVWNRAVVPLAGKSVTHDHYQAPTLNVERVKAPIRVHEPNPHKFDGRTTTSEHYPAWELSSAAAAAAAAAPRVQVPSVARPQYPFEGTSATHDHFQAPTLAPPAPPKPQPAYTPNPHKLDGRTTSQDHYPAWKPSAEAAAAAAAASGRHQVPSMPRPQYKFEGTSATHDHFQAPVHVREALVPRPTYTPNPHKFVGSTTNSEHFQAPPPAQPSRATASGRACAGADRSGTPPPVRCPSEHGAWPASPATRRRRGAQGADSGGARIVASAAQSRLPQG